MDIDKFLAKFFVEIIHKFINIDLELDILC